MPDEVKNQDQGASQGQDDKSKEPTVEEIVKKAVEDATKDLGSKLEIATKEISGLNRKNSELDKALKEEQKSKLTDVEKAQKDLEETKQENERIRKENAELERGRLIDSAVLGAGLPKEFAKRINGSDEKEITEDVKALTKHIEAEVNKRVEVEVNKRLGGKGPEGGPAPKLDDLQAAFDEAKKKGNMPQQIAIKRQAKQDGVTIKE